MQNKISSITREMIRQKLFEHFTGDEIFRLHGLLIIIEETNSVSNAAALLNYWYRADFFYTERSLGLLHPCNALLQSIGMPQIEMIEAEFAFAEY